jgi:hypothetical protein
VDDARRLQIETLRTWSPEQRLCTVGRMIALACAMVDARMRRQHPGISDGGLVRAGRPRARG